MKPMTITLGNGLRAAIRRSEGSAAYVGVAVDAGSRDDFEGRDGLAHFVEHTLFKGTRRRSSLQISNRLESVGGELNAYTSREETLIYAVAPGAETARAVELLADIIGDSIFDERELRKERDVVTEEINLYLDTPSDAVYDLFEENIYAGSRLSHNILGDAESVSRLGSLDFVRRRYTPGHMTLYLVSPLPAERAARLLEKHFGGILRPDEAQGRIAPPPAEHFEVVHDHDTHQAHMVMGCRIFGRTDERRHALFLVNNYLGGPGMSSRLNREIRERRGLAYSVESNVSLLSDCGTFSVYCGTEPQQAARCAKLISREITRLADNPLTPRAFNAVKEQYCGQLLVNSDNRESMAMSMAKGLLYFDKVITAEDAAERVRSVTAEQFREIAEMLAATPLSSVKIS